MNHMVSTGIYTNNAIKNIYIALDYVQQLHLMAVSNSSNNGLLSLINHHLSDINSDILGKFLVQNDSRRGKKVIIL